jgi:predicted GNAT family N-acyltransferase
MAASGDWRVVPFDSREHDRRSFSCTAPELDLYIREIASQDLRRNVARVFVATEPDQNVVIGYYSLSAASFQRASLPAGQAKRLPNYPVPAAFIGRLAVDETRKGRRLGEFLLMDALARVNQASEVLAVQAVIVEARDDGAAAFYRHYGFLPFVEETRRLFLPLGTIRDLVASTATKQPAP